MKLQKLIITLLLMSPGLSMAVTEPIPVPEPGILALLAAGGIAAAVIKFIGKK